MDIYFRKSSGRRELHFPIKDTLSTEELIYLRNVHIYSSGSISKASCQDAAIK